MIASDLSRAVPRGRTYKQAAISPSDPVEDVERVLASIDRHSACGKRDYAHPDGCSRPTVLRSRRSAP